MSEILENNFFNEIDLDVYSCGMGGIGLFGDLFFMFCFVKVIFIKLNFVLGDFELESIS